VLLLVHPAGNKADKAIQQIIDEYKKEFEQESVMRITEQGKTSF
jgi:hypothetical protein